MARSTGGCVPSSRGFALVNLTVQRASRSFCPILAGLSVHSSGMRPSRSASFSAIVLRCLGAGAIVGEAEPEKAHERQPLLDQELRALVRQRMHRLKDQDLGHQHVIEGRPSATGPVRPRHSRLQRGAEHLEVNEPLHALQIAALGGKRREPLINIKETRSPMRHIRTPAVTWLSESIAHRFGGGILEVSN
jgi:hypothetical protein